MSEKSSPDNWDESSSALAATTEVSSQPRSLPSELIDKRTFLQEILKSRRELQIARRQFEQVSDPELVDHIVFRVGAAERHLNYLFRLAREQGISYQGVEWDWTSEEWNIEGVRD